MYLPLEKKNVSRNSGSYEIHHSKIFSTFLFRACFLNTKIKVRICNTVGRDPIPYCKEGSDIREWDILPDKPISQPYSHPSLNHSQRFC